MDRRKRDHKKGISYSNGDEKFKTILVIALTSFFMKKKDFFFSFIAVIKAKENPIANFILDNFHATLLVIFSEKLNCLSAGIKRSIILFLELPET